MALQDDIRQIEKLKDFKDGMKSQRDHLNEVVSAINRIIDAAGNNVLNAQINMTTHDLYFTKAGVLWRGRFAVEGAREI